MGRLLMNYTGAAAEMFPGRVLQIAGKFEIQSPARQGAVDFERTRGIAKAIPRYKAITRRAYSR